MVKVLLFIPNCSILYSQLNTGQLFLHQGVSYLVSYLEKNGYKTRLIDMQKRDYTLQEIKKIVKAENVEFVGITCITPLINEAKKIATIIKQINPHIKTILGGPHPSALPKETLTDTNFDIVIMGEGEQAFLELVKGSNLRNIKGLAYKKGKKIIINPPRQPVGDLNSLPFPAYFSLNVKDYNNVAYYKDSFFGIISSRGCPYNCIYCADHVVHNRNVRLRSPKNLISEVEYLYKKQGIKNFVFYDEVFTIYKQRARSICKEIKKRGLNIRWICATHDPVDEDLLNIMKDSGCEILTYGVESGDQNILNLIQRGVTIKQIEQGVYTANKVGLKVLGLFTLGHPYETEETIKKTIELAKRLPFYNVIFAMIVPFPGTKLWDFVKENKGIKLLTKDYSEFQPHIKPIVESQGLSAKKLEEYHKKAYRIFYFRPNYLLWRLSKTRIQDIWFDIKKSINLLKITR